MLALPSFSVKTDTGFRGMAEDPTRRPDDPDWAANHPIHSGFGVAWSDGITGARIIMPKFTDPWVIVDQMWLMIFPSLWLFLSLVLLVRRYRRRRRELTRGFPVTRMETDKTPA